MLRSRLLWQLGAASAASILLAVGLAQAIHPVLAALVGLALAGAAGYLVSRSIRRLAAAAEALAAGDYEREVPVDRGDELGRLARAINALRARSRQQLETLTLEHDRLMAILRSMGEGVVAVDREERVVHMNQVAGRLLATVPEQALGRPIWEVTRIREIAEVLAETLAQEAPAQRAVHLPGRSDRILELRATPLRNGDAGGLRGAVLVIDDVTRLRRLETVRQDFVGNVSHELKTPITAIRGLVESILDDPRMPPAVARDFLGKIRQQSERLSILVTDLLSLSRLDAGAGGLKLEPVDAREPVLDSIHALQPSSEAKGVRIDAELPGEPLLVLGEAELLQEAVRNLLDNAIKYSPAGGRVALRLRAEEEPEPAVVIEVEDRGPGIEKRHQERIFERFYRIDKARSRALGGTGLGLAIVKHVARALGGEVAVDSEPGAGSTFRIRLPRYREG
ncbi:MAG: HAMP domain-containing protein [Acidobacteria bacterium]|nr:MAG: HAMP domain-containing protein [Acidobacteriota bacterium]